MNVLPQEMSEMKIRSKKTEQIELEIDHTLYSGALAEGETCCIVTNEQGERMTVQIWTGADGEEPAAEIPLENADTPHLLLPRCVLRDGDRRFLCTRQPEAGRYCTLEKLLFGQPPAQMSIFQRMLLALSLAAAFQELEEHLPEEALRQLRLDALLVEQVENMDFAAVRIQVGDLCIPCTEEERESLYRHMARNGCLPPEWYEDPKRDPANWSGLRHLLAVLIFRIMCGADPFDGADTLEQYPYKGGEALRRIYGCQARFVLTPGSDNAQNWLTGNRADLVFRRICQPLQQIFHRTFTQGVSDPARRPSPREWVENQRRVLDWLVQGANDWRIPDMKDGGSPHSGQFRLYVENGTILPVVSGKSLYQYEFAPAGSPIQETYIGVMMVQKDCIVFHLEGEPDIQMKKQPQNTWIRGSRCQLARDPQEIAAMGQKGE